MAKKAAKEGVKKILVSISDEGEFDAEIFNEDEKVIVDKKTNDFLQEFFNNNKNLL